MNVEYPNPARAGITESMFNTAWRRKERARTATPPLAVNEKFDLALDDIERVGVVRVRVRVDSFPAVLERAFYHLQIREQGNKPETAVLSVQPLALGFGYKGSVHSGCIMTYLVWLFGRSGGTSIAATGR
jgi:hypothetical protein